MSEFKIKRAIISVWDKTNIIALAQALRRQGVEIYSTGGTFKALQTAGIAVEKIENLTGFPEILGGRVKTLHPVVFAGLLADTTEESHRADLARVQVEAIQLVVVNLYPFSETYHAGNKSFEEIVEMIDIGGPSMLRAASKNFKNVVILSDPKQYDEFQQRLEKGELTPEYRQSLARDVFLKTTAYDSEIAEFLSETGEPLPTVMAPAFYRQQSLRYGENPDQGAALYAPLAKPAWQPFKQLQGKEISFNNYVDCLAAYKCYATFKTDAAAVVIMKHTNPCGFAIGKTALAAYQRAVKTDPVSYFGGIVGVNREIDGALAEEFSKSFLECIIAPGYSAEALEILSKRKNLRLLIPDADNLNFDLDMRAYGQGLLVQQNQSPNDDETAWKVVTETQPPADLMPALKMAWHVVKHVKSNAIVFCDANGTIGVGAGQMSRVDSVKIAIRKAGEAGLTLKNAVMASDAYFPFRDSVDVAAQEGIVGIIQPGGSVRDEDSITACNEHKLFMIFTGKRVFKH
ncbi:MAG: bifunctional phosphoribosylaminoimidazolecarboxamide formyltransferase/IMP cyclohydrolase [Candidatus Marinimicrobia bacterium]|jgi:phosphoribosylaminoimidazolecarboxamide formyltransferase/IMP cyclohydrolase|nr:bifunctional phosphoribosylaminoimidazolecarboxamide formyltransferase/IMP cyclohydrolase [Candidatus Neomarinimicrobiota bacterium]